jgi:hypothetical protein
MTCLSRFFLACAILAPLFLSGCATNTGTGAVVGGATGAGVGALIGSASGHAGAGAAIGAGVGALTGAVVGNSVDEQEKRNRAILEAQVGHSLAGRVTKEEIVSMTQYHVDEALIINHIRAHGMAAPLSTGDIIWLQQSGVTPPVIATMQEAPPPPTAVIVEQPAPVVVGGYYYGRPRRYYY